MGGLARRKLLARLEARAAASRSALVELAEARRRQSLASAVVRLSDEDLGIVGGIVDRALEHARPGSTTNLYALACSGRERQALAALAAAVADVQSAEQSKLTRGA